MSPRGNRPIKGLYGGDARGLYGSSSFGRRNTMIYGKPKRKWPKFLIIIIIVILVIVLIHQFACSGGSSKDTEKSKAKTTQTEATTSKVDSSDTTTTGADGTVTITALGDCTLGTDPTFGTANTFDVKYDSLGKSAAKYFFKRVTRFTAADDLTIANCEGTFTTSDDRAENKEFCFKGPEKYANIFVKGSVEAVNLANNHTFDYGQQGYDDTKAALEKYNITSFGFDRTNTYEVNGIKIGLLGINCLNSYDDAKSIMTTDIKALQDEDCQIIIGMFHWGVEGSYDVTTDQVNLAHAAIDAGVDLVLGGHPHVLQGIEQYNGRYIVYSLGNFCFGGNDHPSDFATMMWQQTFTVSNGEVVMDDNTSQAVTVIPCRVSSSSTTLNDYQPLPVGGSDATKVLKKVNKSSKKLTGQYVLFNTEVDDSDCATIKTIAAAKTTESTDTSTSADTSTTTTSTGNGTSTVTVTDQSTTQ